MNYYALVPAAGSGARMGGELPKQYLSLLGQPVVHHAIAALCASPQLAKVFVVLAAEDTYWAAYDWSSFGERLVVLRCGGATRAESVRNGLAAIRADVAQDDWVLVHDAARACLTPGLVQQLIDRVGKDDVGGLLAVPVADTLKLADAHRVARTVPRDGLWQAQTPQMFRHRMLSEALAACSEVTDEASAIEFMGLHPLLVPGEATNLKITYPQDLRLAGLILESRR